MLWLKGKTVFWANVISPCLYNYQLINILNYLICQYYKKYEYSCDYTQYKYHSSIYFYYKNIT